MIVNITPHNFGGRLRCGDILGACNILESLRETDSDMVFHFSSDSLFDADYVYLFKDFLTKHTNYFSDIPGDHYLNFNNVNLWDYRSNIKDNVKVDNVNYIKQNKICIFPLFDAPYNIHRNWNDGLTNSLIEYYCNNFLDYEILLCSSINNASRIKNLQLNRCTVSYNFLDNLNHIMDCKIFIGGDTGVSHLSGSLISPPENIYYYSCRGLMQSFPLHWKHNGDLRCYSDYGFIV